MKIIFLITVFVIFWFSVGWVSADERNFPEGPQGPKGNMGDPGLNGSDASINPNDYQSGTALGMALSAHQFDFDTDQTQVSVGTAYFQGPSAVSVGAAKRVGRALVSGSVGTTSQGGNAGSAAIGFRF